MTVGRRAVLKGLAVPALAGLAGSGCGLGGRAVRVAVTWSGDELTRFRRVLRPFSEQGWNVSVLSVGDDIAAFLGNRVAVTATPDVALVSRPSLVRQHVTQLNQIKVMPVPSSGWQRLLSVGGKTYGTWFKVAHKSMVWYRPDLIGAVRPPADWQGWTELCRDLAAAGRPPLSIGAADEWVLTDWFENVLLSIDPCTYTKLARPDPDHPGQSAARWKTDSVHKALFRLGDLWSVAGLFPGGPRRALLTQFDQSVLDVFTHGRAAMVAGADFAWPIITRYGRASTDRVSWFGFPYGPGEHKPVLVGGDAAVLLKNSKGGGRLIEWLQNAKAAEFWAKDGGFLSLAPGVRDYPSALRADDLVAEVRSGGGSGFDLSDQLGGRLAGAEGRGSWKILKDFFVDVAVHRSPVEKAVGRAVTAFASAAGGRTGG